MQAMSDYTSSDDLASVADDSPSSEYGQGFYAVGSDPVPPNSDPLSPMAANIQGPEAQPGDNAFIEALWDVGGALPFVGTPISYLSTAIDLGAAGLNALSGDSEAARRNLENAGLDALGVIPVVGNILSAQLAVENFDAMSRRESGASAEEAPTVIDNWAKNWDDTFGHIPARSGGIEGSGGSDGGGTIDPGVSGEPSAEEPSMSVDPEMSVDPSL
jgi:hypothetical protein